MDNDVDCSCNEGYCTPDDVIDILGMRDSITGDPSYFSDKTNPTYDSVVKRIQAESEMFDNRTHDSWQVHKIRNFIFDRGQEWALTNMQFYGPPHHKGGWCSQLLPNIRPFEPALGDKLEIRTDKNHWSDISDKEDELFWFDYENGMFYYMGASPIIHNAFRITYRYGRTTEVPPDIRDVVAKRVASWIMQTDFYRSALGQGSGLTNKSEIINAWNKDYDMVVLSRANSCISISLLP